MIVVDKDTIQLVEHPTEVEKIDLTGLGKGTKHTFTDGGLTAGIGIRAVLESTIRNETEVDIGAKENPLEDAFTASNGVGMETLKAFYETYKKVKEDQEAKSAKTNTGSDTQKPTNDGWSRGGGVALTWAAHTVNAKVGSSVSDGDRASLLSGADVDVLAQVQQKAQLTSKTFMAKPEDPTGQKSGSSTDKPVAVAIATAVYQNETNAIVAGKADIDAVGKITVKAETTYPFITP